MVDSASYNFMMHYSFIGGYKFFLSDKLLIEPSAILKVKGRLGLSSFDLNTLITYDNTYSNKRGIETKEKDIHVYTGVTYRPGKFLSLIIGGLFAKKYEINYSVDLLKMDYKLYRNKVHELTLGYRFYPGQIIKTANSGPPHFR